MACVVSSPSCAFALRRRCSRSSRRACWRCCPSCNGRSSDCSREWKLALVVVSRPWKLALVASWPSRSSLPSASAAAEEGSGSCPVASISISSASCSDQPETERTAAKPNADGVLLSSPGFFLKLASLNPPLIDQDRVAARSDMTPPSAAEVKSSSTSANVGMDCDFLRSASNAANVGWRDSFELGTRMIEMG